MDEKKLFARLCPKCGEVCAEHQFAKVALGPGAHVNMSCSNGHRWTEFYNLDYQGFWWKDKKYDTYGEPKN